MHETSVQFESGGTVLQGSLVIPFGSGRFPALVFLHGAGWGERRYYYVFAREFAGAGIASLLFDRRGEGESHGTVSQDTAILAEDAKAAFRHAKNCPAIDPERIGVWGYSNGAWVAALAAGSLPDLSCVVLVGASAVSPGAAEIYRRSCDLRAQGVDEATIARVNRAWSIIFEYGVTGVWKRSWHEELEGLADAIMSDEQVMRLPVPEFARKNPLLRSVPPFDVISPRKIKDVFGGVAGWLGFDPLEPLRRVEAPILIMLAELDENVPTGESAKRFEEALSAAGHTDFQIEIMSGADHFFSPYRLSERSAEEFLNEPRERDDFVPHFLPLMTQWLRGKLCN